MTTQKVQIFKKHKFIGGLGNHPNWWSDINFEHSYTIFDIDYFYQEDYYKKDPVDFKTVQYYVDYILEYGKRLLGRNVKSILELGSGGGWFTEEFLKRGIKIQAIEGSTVGVKKSIERGIPAERIIHHDLRLPLKLDSRFDRSFDMVVCTEVAEHIEQPFSSQLISNIVNYSKLVWFSFESPRTNSDTYDHCNEQPEKFWKNLFQFFDYEMIKLPTEVIKRVRGRGGYIFYSRDLRILDLYNLNEEIEGISLALGGELQQISPVKTIIRKLLPPIIIGFLNFIYKKTGRKRKESIGKGNSKVGSEEYNEEEDE